MLWRKTDNDLVEQPFGVLVLPLYRTLTPAQKLSLPGEMTTLEELVVSEHGTVTRKVTGKKEVIKGTQVYPEGYGDAVYRSWKKWYQSPVQEDPQSSESDYEECVDDWGDAQLQEILDMMVEGIPDCPRVW